MNTVTELTRYECATCGVVDERPHGQSPDAWVVFEPHPNGDHSSMQRCLCRDCLRMVFLAMAQPPRSSGFRYGLVETIGVVLLVCGIGIALLTGCSTSDIRNRLLDEIRDDLPVADAPADPPQEPSEPEPNPPVAWQPPAGYTSDLGPMVTVTVPAGHENAGKRFAAHATGYMDYYGRNAARAARGAITWFHDQHGGVAFPDAQIIGTYVRVLAHMPGDWGTPTPWVARVAIIWRLEHGYTIHAGINHANDGVIGYVDPTRGNWVEGLYYIVCDRRVGMTTLHGNHVNHYQGMPIHLRD